MMKIVKVVPNPSSDKYIVDPKRVKPKCEMTLISFFFLLLLMFTSPTHPLPETIKIGGLFDVSDTVQEIAFR